MENVSILSYDDKDVNIPNNVTLSMPSSVQGGSYFTKIHYAKRPMYMQSPKCVSKQGVTTVGKKMYVELVISNEKDGEFISFLKKDTFGLPMSWKKQTLKPHLLLLSSRIKMARVIY